MVRRGIALLVTVLLIHGSTGPAFAGFASDWIANKTATGGGSFEGQKRGYLYGGSMSARWRNSNDYLFTINRPKLSAGCGGIDLFAGGFSFLGFDYLVSKFQNMVMNAPAVIFDIALKALSEQLSGSIKALDHIIETINGIQVDDCATTKTMVAATGLESWLSKGKKSPTEDSSVITSTLTTANTHLGKFSNWVSGHEAAIVNDQPKQVDIEDSVKLCSQDTLNTLLQNHVGGSLLQSVLVTRLQFDSDVVALFRGLIGDVKIGTSAEAYAPLVTPPCSQNSAIDNIDDIKAGTVYVQAAPGGECTPMADGINLNAEAEGLVDAIITKMKSGTAAFTPAEVAKIEMMSYPAYGVLKTAVMAGTDSMAKAEIVKIAAAGLAYGFFVDLAGRIEDGLNEAVASNKATGPADVQNASNQCQPLFLIAIKDSLQALQAEADKRVDLFYDAYTKEVAEVNTLVNNLASHQQNKELVEANTNKILKTKR